MTIRQIRIHKMKLKHKFIGGISLFIALFACSCSNKETYSEFYSFKEAAWTQEECASFEVEISDTLALYSVFLDIRNNNDYPFRNIWLFVDTPTQEGTQTDTIQVELADIYGKWHGNGLSKFTYSTVYKKDYKFPSSGTYSYSIRHGMRENPLRGISDIGLRIEKQ